MGLKGYNADDDFACLFAFYQGKKEVAPKRCNLLLFRKLMFSRSKYSLRIRIVL